MALSLSIYIPCQLKHTCVCARSNRLYTFPDWAFVCVYVVFLWPGVLHYGISVVTGWNLKEHDVSIHTRTHTHTLNHIAQSRPEARGKHRDGGLNMFNF